jgi:plastocyanin
MSRSPKTLLLLGFCASYAAAASCGGSTGTDMAAATNTVTVSSSTGALSFSPQNLTIKAGDTVQWNFASGGHNVISGSGNNGTFTPDGKFCSTSNTDCTTAAGVAIPSGTTYSFTFPTAGTYPYFCGFHSTLGMTGTITVQ